MKSADLVNWETVGYAHAALDGGDELNLALGRNAYGKGSWASSLRHHRGTFYVTTFSGTTGRTYIYRTKDIEHGPWEAVSFRPLLHDHSLFFDEDDRVYMVHGGGTIRLVELNEDLSGLKAGGVDQVIVPNASAPAGTNLALPAEGSQLFKIHGKYCLFNIAWPRGGMRTVIVHRADKLTGPYEGRVALQDRGIAQGGLIDTPQGQWYAYLFQDHGAVGRIPFLVPVRWEDDWPVLGIDGKVPDTLDLPASRGLMPGLVAADEFARRPGEPALPLAWQWNHNPDPAGWSLVARPGFLRFTTGRIDADFPSARNTLTQRTFGPTCSATTMIDVSGLKDGDCAGLALLQKKYGWIGVKSAGGSNQLVMVSAGSDHAVELESVPLTGSTVHLRADCDFRDRADTAHFLYSLDGRTWSPLGGPLKMAYTLPHFMGYRFGLFCYATKTTGGHADFDYFRPAASIPPSDKDARP
jgi:beta-xylosidase